MLPEIEAALSLSDSTAWATGAVQLGFILGTLGLSATGLADRVSPRVLFLVACLAAGLTNAIPGLIPLVPAVAAGGLPVLLGARFATGLALAGVYPIGMKVAAGWYREGLGGALGWLVGALVLGTACPHGLRALSGSVELPWTAVVFGTSLLAVGGGLLLASAVPDGPYLSPPGKVGGLQLSAIPELLGSSDYRAAAWGYFGHMWELYTFWALLPALVAHFTGLPVSWTAFTAIAVGALGCVVGGWVSSRVGSAAVARFMLVGSAFCCGVAPFLLDGPDAVVLGFLLVWGVLVVGDSPQLSALSAQSAPAHLVGTGLALATALGFGLTIVSLEVASRVPLGWMPWILLPGPLAGLFGLFGLRGNGRGTRGRMAGEDV